LKPEFIEFIENARKPRGQRFRNQLSVFLVCLVLSVFIWTLVRLSKEYIYTVSYHVRYIDVPQNLRLTASPDTILRLNIRIQGFDFFSDQYFKRKSQEVDVSLRNVKFLSHDNDIIGYLLTSPIGKEIAGQSSNPLELFSVSPDTLYFKFERKTLRNLPVSRLSPISAGKIRITDSSGSRPDTIVKKANSSEARKKAHRK
jgi:hypothetical protein